MTKYSLAVNMWSLTSVLKIAVLLGIGLCLSLQLIWILPLLINSGVLMLNKVKLARPFLLIGGLTLSAILTPPDVLSQLLLFSPAYLSFETGLLLSKKRYGDEKKCSD
jgi:sec-independent protein translocase protein TatC